MLPNIRLNKRNVRSKNNVKVQISNFNVLTEENKTSSYLILNSNSLMLKLGMLHLLSHSAHQTSKAPPYVTKLY